MTRQGALALKYGTYLTFVYNYDLLVGVLMGNLELSDGHTRWARILSGGSLFIYPLEMECCSPVIASSFNIKRVRTRLK